MAKISLYINQEVWAKFRGEVSRKYGSLRKLSSKVETILSSDLVGDKIASKFKELGDQDRGHNIVRRNKREETSA